jgi:SAM-dependent methyltransferase
VTCPLCGHTAAVEIAAAGRTRVVRCAMCRLAYCHPRRLTDDIRTEYEAVYARVTEPVRMTTRRRNVFAEFLERVPPADGARLLDVGCATGEFLELARGAGWMPTGVEISSRAAAIARARGFDVHAHWDELPAGAFAAVTLWNVIDYFEYPVQALQGIHRVLVPGGLLFIRTPNERFQLGAWRLSRRLEWCRPLRGALADSYYFQPLLWGATTLPTLLMQSGYSGVRVWNSRPTAGDPYHARSRAREAAVGAAKRLVHASARAAETATRGRLLLGSSLSALARKPAA